MLCQRSWQQQKPAGWPNFVPKYGCMYVSDDAAAAAPAGLFCWPIPLLVPTLSPRTRPGFWVSRNTVNVVPTPLPTFFDRRDVP